MLCFHTNLSSKTLGGTPILPDGGQGVIPILSNGEEVYPHPSQLGGYPMLPDRRYPILMIGVPPFGQWGYPVWLMGVPLRTRWEYFPYQYWMGGVPISLCQEKEQQSEHLLRGEQYASCVYTWGLSCFQCFCIWCDSCWKDTHWH